MSSGIVRSLLAIAALAPLALTVGCQKREAAAPEAATTTKPAEEPRMHDGTPRIVDAPDRVHIQYRLYGQGDLLVVLIHGWSCDSNYWAAQLDDLKKRYTVMTVDLAGHGASGANRKEWSMAAFGGDVAASVNAAVMEQPRHTRVVLVGHSMGGPVAIEAARLLGPLAAGVIGVDTYQDVGTPQPSAAKREQQLQPFLADFISTTRGFVTSSFFTANADPTLKRKIADDMSSAPPEVAIASIRALGDWDGATAMPSLSIPIVAINSDLRGVTDAARVQKIVPQFQLVTVSGLGHFLMMEDPARFNPLLIEQIDRMVAPAKT